MLSVYLIFIYIGTICCQSDSRMSPESRSFIRHRLRVLNPERIIIQDVNITRNIIAREDIVKNAIYAQEHSKVFSSVSKHEIRVINSINQHSIPVSIYMSKNYTSGRPIIVYCHGGGWILNTRHTIRPSLMHLAADTFSIWLSVEYRLAPEHKFPIGLDDCKSVVQFVLANKTSINTKAQNAPVGVAGDSAGANFAAVIGNELGKQINFQILVYGTFTGLRKTLSKEKFSALHFLHPPKYIKWVHKNYLGNNQSSETSPRFAPILGVSNQTPKTLFISAELDSLIDDTINYANLLDKNNVIFSLKIIPGTVHHFFAEPNRFPIAYSQAKSHIIKFLKQI